MHSADIQDRDGCKLLLDGFDLKTIKKIFVDGGYAGKIIKYVKEKYEVLLEVVKRTDLHKFIILKKRWIVERTNSWMTTCKRLTRDYENKIQNQEAMIYLRIRTYAPIAILVPTLKSWAFCSYQVIWSFNLVYSNFKKATKQAKMCDLWDFSKME